MKVPLNIFEYNDYRRLLEDYFALKNDRMKGRYSYRAFAKDAGFGSPNYIQLILKKQKNLAESGIHSLSLALGLSAREHDFFEALVRFNQASDADKRSYYLKRVLSFREFAKSNRLLEDHFLYFSKWYNVAIRELISLPSFRYDMRWVAKNLLPTISTEEAKAAMDLLYRLGMIARQPDGEWALTNAHIHTDPEVQSATLLEFHREMLTRSLDSLSQPAENRDVSAITMAIDRTQFDEVKKRMVAFRHDMQQYLIDNPKTPDRVCQLNMQFFHMSKA